MCAAALSLWTGSSRLDNLAYVENITDACSQHFVMIESILKPISSLAMFDIYSQVVVNCYRDQKRL